jgi:hypothetical protein
LQAQALDASGRKHKHRTQASDAPAIDFFQIVHNPERGVTNLHSSHGSSQAKTQRGLNQGKPSGLFHAVEGRGERLA